MTGEILDCKTVGIFAYSSTREQSKKERDWGETLKILLTRRACDASTVCARKAVTPRFTDFFTDFEEQTDCFAV